MIEILYCIHHRYNNLRYMLLCQANGWFYSRMSEDIDARHDKKNHVAILQKWEEYTDIKCFTRNNISVFFRWNISTPITYRTLAISLFKSAVFSFLFLDPMKRTRKKRNKSVPPWKQNSQHVKKTAHRLLLPANANGFQLMINSCYLHVVMTRSLLSG